MKLPRETIYWVTAVSFGPALFGVWTLITHPDTTYGALPFSAVIDLVSGVLIASLAFVIFAAIFRRTVGIAGGVAVAAHTIAFPLVSGVLLIAFEILNAARILSTAPELNGVSVALRRLLDATFYRGSYIVLPLSWLAVMVLRWAHRRAYGRGDDATQGSVTVRA